MYVSIKTPREASRYKKDIWEEILVYEIDNHFYTPLREHTSVNALLIHGRFTLQNETFVETYVIDEHHRDLVN